MTNVFPQPCDDGVTLSMRFPDSETAKLALEAAVREGPIDRRCAEIDLDDDRVTMRLEVPEADAIEQAQPSPLLDDDYDR